MKAVVYERYGPPERLRPREVPRPTPGDDEVLIRLHATSINASDWELLTATPAYARIWGLLRPRHTILGSDIAGRVEAVGRAARRFRPGDAVLGDNFGRWGGLAEYVCAPQDALLHKPQGMTFEEAAALPQAGVVALQGLRDKGRLRPGQRVLINGAGGGAGTFALQLARHHGAEVTGVDSGCKQELMRALGADHVIDYAREDFTRGARRYDLVLDFVLRRSVHACARALAPAGRYVVVGGDVPRLLQLLLLGPWLSLTRGQQLGLLGWSPNTRDLAALAQLHEAGEVKPVIDRCYPLAEAAEALRYLGAGQARGKVVISMA
jgi:NADPH:quinone reductase-like Zn-dependent oxidoreductase